MRKSDILEEKKYFIDLLTLLILPL